MTASLSIYYATMTGNAECLARRAYERAMNEGWRAELHNLSEVKPADLAADGHALFIVSTWGDGEPPDDARDFHTDLFKADLDLSSLRYAVLGLGDRDYTEFNAFARQLDERLATFNARRVHERIEADVQFEDTYAEWEARIFPVIAEMRTAPTSAR